MAGITDSYPDAWRQEVLISIGKMASGESFQEFRTQTESVEISLPNKDVEAIPCIGGNRLVKYIPAEMAEISFEAYLVSTEEDYIPEWFAGTTDSNGDSDEYEFKFGSNRHLFHIVLTWTNDYNNTSAASTVADHYAAFRYEFKHAYLISCNGKWEDNMLKFTFKFKVAPFDNNGNSNINTSSSKNGLSAISLDTTPYIT
ncbi:MAG: hypothetical protein ACTSQY_01000 [Candidatus Odinarchaeia archaeon]